MKRKIILSAVLAGALGVMGACGTEEKQEKEEGSEVEVPKEIEVDEEAYQDIISPNNELGFKLLSEVKADVQGNTFISPTSLFAALSMVYNGADGETKEEIAKVLQVKGISVEELNQANASLFSVLKQDTEGIQLDIANSIWLNDKFHFQEEFAESNKNYFNATLNELNFADQDSAKEINDWVKAATKDKIEDMVDDPLSQDLVAILLNAIYFKGDWMYEFDQELTEQRPFQLKDGSTKEVPLMMMQRELVYMENDDFQAVKLPYGEGKMSMSVFLPKETTDIDAFEKSLTAENWSQWHTAFMPQEGSLQLPKFQMEYEVILNESLGKLGMESAFDKDANFTKMVQEEASLSISEVKQKTYIDVNEVGTEAAAATSVGIRTTAALLDEPFQMEVNRPFFIAITDDETGMILFMGTIENPQQTE